ncbi:7324_t:CDS:10 [Acaulospora colombiana]|uniref:7324_t:CDS:1 n=1 Tax=Acaulospora colombiana TaxID=27376 RepID=A0ACA9N848_9GLOM|nr:7324_t:CDS:10 [Acaulospora colombiana]
MRKYEAKNSLETATGRGLVCILAVNRRAQTCLRVGDKLGQESPKTMEGLLTSIESNGTPSSRRGTISLLVSYWNQTGRRSVKGGGRGVQARDEWYSSSRKMQIEYIDTYDTRKVQLCPNLSPYKNYGSLKTRSADHTNELPGKEELCLVGLSRFCLSTHYRLEAKNRLPIVRQVHRWATHPDSKYRLTEPEFVVWVIGGVSGPTLSLEKAMNVNNIKKYETQNNLEIVVGRVLVMRLSGFFEAGNEGAVKFMRTTCRPSKLRHYRRTTPIPKSV